MPSQGGEQLSPEALEALVRLGYALPDHWWRVTAIAHTATHDRVIAIGQQYRRAHLYFGWCGPTSVCGEAQAQNSMLRSDDHLSRHSWVGAAKFCTECLEYMQEKCSTTLLQKTAPK